MEGHGLGPLGRRLAAAFVGVAMFAVAVFAVVVLLVDRRDINTLADTQRSQVNAAVVSSLRHAYQSAHGWSRADFQPAATLAAATGTSLELADLDGTVLLSKGTFGQPGAVAVHDTIADGGRPVGQLRVAFPAGGLTAGEGHLRALLVEAVAWSALLAAAGGLVVGLVVARQLVRPIRRLSAVVGAFRLGGDDEAVGPHAGPGELGELGRAFDTLATSLQREDRLRRALAADVAHELRTPIAVLQAETEALMDGITVPSAAAMVSLHDETVRVGRMVDDLQSLASAEAAGLHLDRRPLDLARVAAQAADSMRPRFHSAEVALDEQLPPVVVMGDPGRLHQVVANLLANAVKFTPQGGQVTLTVGTAGDEAFLEVADNGPGVPEAERARVWDRFYRGSAARSTGGSGIGLAVVNELVAAHSGSVGLRSATGGGAIFEVHLPLA
ncbi:MAG: sensor histidine kinase [Acidimicrobiales bacterium]